MVVLEPTALVSIIKVVPELADGATVGPSRLVLGRLAPVTTPDGGNLSPGTTLLRGNLDGAVLDPGTRVIPSELAPGARLDLGRLDRSTTVIPVPGIALTSAPLITGGTPVFWLIRGALRAVGFGWRW